MKKIDLRRKYIIYDAINGKILYDIFEYSKLRRSFGEDDIIVERDGKVDEVYTLVDVDYDSIYVDYKYHK